MGMMSGPGAVAAAPVPVSTYARGTDVTDAICSIDGCEKRGKITRGWCQTHYRRWSRTGSLHVVRDQKRENNPNWRGDALTYSGAHQRVRYLRGPASAQPCAQQCGRPAAEWAFTYGEDPQPHQFSSDPADYRPLCRPCHKAYDMEHLPASYTRPKKLTTEQAADAIRRVGSGETRAAVARSYGVTSQAIDYWLNRRQITTTR